MRYHFSLLSSFSSPNVISFKFVTLSVSLAMVVWMVLLKRSIKFDNYFLVFCAMNQCALRVIIADDVHAG